MAASPSFQEVVERHYAALYRFAFSLARDEAEASDLTQETFLIWARKGHQLRDANRAGTWLFTTLYREFQRHRRRTEALAETPLDDGVLELPSPAPDAIQRMDPSLVQAAMLGLTEHHRAVLSLYYLTEHTYQEVAEIVGVPVGTIMSRLARAKAELRKALTGKMDVAPKRTSPPQSPSSAADRKEKPDGSR